MQKNTIIKEDGHSIKEKQEDLSNKNERRNLKMFKVDHNDVFTNGVENGTYEVVLYNANED
ncbi:hypothetical protein D4C61_15570, partial [Listeria monocytogenes]|nr:hypothetical protein [Listeria monocytogenes]